MRCACFLSRATSFEARLIVVGSERPGPSQISSVPYRRVWMPAKDLPIQTHERRQRVRIHTKLVTAKRTRRGQSSHTNDVGMGGIFMLLLSVEPIRTL